MRRLFGIDVKLMFLLLPYMYTVLTRARTIRDNAANAVTSWIPGIILLNSTLSLNVLECAVYYVAGYFAFISIYEIGYLLNDTVGVRTEVSPRQRLGREVGPIFVWVFVSVRIAIFVAVSSSLGLLTELPYLSMYAALVAAILGHNWVKSGGFKFFTFIQMSTLRFFLPVYSVMLISGGGQFAGIALMVALLLFAFPRVLTYQESKGKLLIPERRRPEFLASSWLLLLPLVCVISLVFGSGAPLAVWAWLCLIGLSVYVLHRLGMRGQ